MSASVRSSEPQSSTQIVRPASNNRHLVESSDSAGKQASTAARASFTHEQLAKPASRPACRINSHSLVESSAGTEMLQYVSGSEMYPRHFLNTDSTMNRAAGASRKDGNLAFRPVKTRSSVEFS